MDRRTVLTGGVGGLTAMIAGCLGESEPTTDASQSTVRSGGEWPVVKRTRSFDTPLARSDLTEMRRAAREAVEAEGVEPVVTDPVVGAGESTVVGRAVTFDETGRMHHYTVGANAPRDVDTAHQRLDAVASGFQAKAFRVGRASSTPALAGGVDVTTGETDEWRIYDHGRLDELAAPHGIVTVEYAVGQFQRGPTDRNAYVVDSVCGVEPGQSAYESGWRGTTGTIRHDYEMAATQTTNPELHHLEPTSHAEAEPVTVDMSLGGNLRWSYDPGFGLHSKSSYAENYAEWATQFHPDALCGQKDPGQTEPGSVVWIAPSAGTETLLELRHGQTFQTRSCLPSETARVTNEVRPATKAG